MVVWDDGLINRLLLCKVCVCAVFRGEAIATLRPQAVCLYCCFAPQLQDALVQVGLSSVLTIFHFHKAVPVLLAVVCRSIIIHNFDFRHIHVSVCQYLRLEKCKPGTSRACFQG